MTEFGIENATLRGLSALRGAATAAAFRNRALEQTIAVDVGASATKAEISRGGFAVAEIGVLPERIGSFLTDRPIVQTKVVTQTIAPGTAVAAGTTIDVVLTVTRDLPVAVIPGIHEAFSGLTMAQLHDQFATDTRVRDILRTKTDVSDLNTDDIASLTTALQAQNIPVSNDPGQTVASAFTAIQAAFTFQS